MQKLTITLEVDIDAHSPIEGARKALAMIVNTKRSKAHKFMVSNGKEITKINLDSKCPFCEGKCPKSALTEECACNEYLDSIHPYDIKVGDEVIVDNYYDDPKKVHTMRSIGIDKYGRFIFKDGYCTSYRSKHELIPVHK